MILIDRVLELQALIKLEFREFDLLPLLCLVFNEHLKRPDSRVSFLFLLTFLQNVI